MWLLFEFIYLFNMRLQLESGLRVCLIVRLMRKMRMFVYAELHKSVGMSDSVYMLEDVYTCVIDTVLL